MTLASGMDEETTTTRQQKQERQKQNGFRHNNNLSSRPDFIIVGSQKNGIENKSNRSALTSKILLRTTSMSPAALAGAGGGASHCFTLCGLRKRRRRTKKHNQFEMWLVPRKIRKPATSREPLGSGPNETPRKSESIKRSGPQKGFKMSSRSPTVTAQRLTGRLPRIQINKMKVSPHDCDYLFTVQVQRNHSDSLNFFFLYIFLNQKVFQVLNLQCW